MSISTSQIVRFVTVVSGVGFELRSVYVALLRTRLELSYFCHPNLKLTIDKSPFGVGRRIS
jgi:hypothetical protein